jgi:hypothetical protein
MRSLLLEFERKSENANPKITTVGCCSRVGKLANTYICGSWEEVRSHSSCFLHLVDSSDKICEAWASSQTIISLLDIKRDNGTKGYFNGTLAPRHAPRTCVCPWNGTDVTVTLTATSEMKIHEKSLPPRFQFEF